VSEAWERISQLRSRIRDEELPYVFEFVKNTGSARALALAPHSLLEDFLLTSGIHLLPEEALECATVTGSGDLVDASFNDDTPHATSE
jgi:hypothetical protein